MAVPILGKLGLSGDDSGLPIEVTDNSSPGTTIHTVTSDPDEFEEVWLYASSRAGVDVELTIVFDHSGDLREMPIGIPAGFGLIRILPGMRFDDGIVIKAYVPAGYEDLLMMSGHTTRIHT